MSDIKIKNHGENDYTNQCEFKRRVHVNEISTVNALCQHPSEVDIKPASLCNGIVTIAIVELSYDYSSPFLSRLTSEREGSCVRIIRTCPRLSARIYSSFAS